MIRRTALAARRAGFGRVVVADASPAAERALEGTGAELAPTAPPGAARLPWNVAVHVKDLKELAANDTAGASVGVAVASAADLPRAESFLLKGLVKDTEGFMSRHFDRRISLAVSRRLAGTRVTPNQMTLVSRGDRPDRRAVLPVAAPGRPGDRRRALPAPLDPRRMRRRARPPEVPGVALGRHARFLGRQRRAHGGLRDDGRGPRPLDRSGSGPSCAAPRPCSRRRRRPRSSTGGR